MKGYSPKPPCNANSGKLIASPGEMMRIPISDTLLAQSSRSLSPETSHTHFAVIAKTMNLSSAGSRQNFIAASSGGTLTHEATDATSRKNACRCSMET